MLRKVLGIEQGALIIGAGGGGDVAGAMHTGLMLAYEQIPYTLCALVWERLSVDPAPGPVPLDCFRNIEHLTEHVVRVSSQTYVEREGRRFKPQIANVLEALEDSVPGIVFDPYTSLGQVAKELAEICSQYSIDVVIVVDAGGDILTTGNEETVLSPLADTYTLALAKMLQKQGLRVYIGIYGPGCDGEIPKDELFRRFSDLAKTNHFITFVGITPDIAQKLEKILEKVHTEASRLPLRAYRGETGIVKIRRGERCVSLDITCAGTYYITVEGACRINKLALLAEPSDNILKLREKLNSRGILTELDIEEALVARGLVAKVDAEAFMRLIYELRQNIRRRLSQP